MRGVKFTGIYKFVSDGKLFARVCDGPDFIDVERERYEKMSYEPAWDDLIAGDEYDILVGKTGSYLHFLIERVAFESKAMLFDYVRSIEFLRSIKFPCDLSDFSISSIYRETRLSAVSTAYSTIIISNSPRDEINKPSEIEFVIDLKSMTFENEFISGFFNRTHEGGFWFDCGDVSNPKGLSRYQLNNLRRIAAGKMAILVGKAKDR